MKEFRKSVILCIYEIGKFDGLLCYGPPGIAYNRPIYLKAAHICAIIVSLCSINEWLLVENDLRRRQFPLLWRHNYVVHTPALLCGRPSIAGRINALHPCSQGEPHIEPDMTAFHLVMLLVNGCHAPSRISLKHVNVNTKQLLSRPGCLVVSCSSCGTLEPRRRRHFLFSVLYKLTVDRKTLVSGISRLIISIGSSRLELHDDLFIPMMCMC